MDIRNRSDGQLLAEFSAQGRDAPFEELVRRHGALVYNVCRRALADAHDAEDAAQAVFLTLAQKAASLRGRDSVAGWLHKVAWHVAKRGQEAAAVRKRYEREAAGRAGEALDAASAWRKIAPHLDPELDALPEKFRLPLVLHHLEGYSEEEGAKRLGWKRGTFSSRLSRARELLRERLARRGEVLSVAALAGLLSEQASAAELPAAFAGTTAKAASLMAAGKAAAGGLVSAQTTALTKGALKMLYLAKVKVAAAVLFALALLGGGAGVGVAAWRAQAGEAAAPRGIKNKDANDERPKVADVPKEIRGQKILVEFDIWGSAGGAQEIKRRLAKIETALQRAGVKMVKKTLLNMFLLDCGGNEPKAALKSIPYRMGGMVFHDGRFHNAIPYENFYQKGEMLVPEPFASLGWGSGGDRFLEMEEDIKKFSKIPSIVAEKVNTMPGKLVAGNPWILKLTPAKGKTLLEVFLLVKKARFHYMKQKAGFQRKGSAQAKPSAPAGPKVGMAVLKGKAKAIAWGKAQNGVRLGLAPAKLVIPADAASFSVKVTISTVTDFPSVGVRSSRFSWGGRRKAHVAAGCPRGSVAVGRGGPFRRSGARRSRPVDALSSALPAVVLP